MSNADPAPARILPFSIECSVLILDSDWYEDRTIGARSAPFYLAAAIISRFADKATREGICVYNLPPWSAGPLRNEIALELNESF